MGAIWNTLIVQPFAWLLLNLYNLTHSYGLAVILFALITRLLLLYFSAKGKKGMMQQQRIIPKQKELEKQYGKDKQRYNLELQKLYEKEGVSMTGGCLWTLLPFPVLMALYGVLREPVTNLMRLGDEAMAKVAGFLGVEPLASGGYDQLAFAQSIQEAFAGNAAAFNQFLAGADIQLQEINFHFLGLNLLQTPQWPWNGLSWLILIPILSGVTAYLSSFLSRKFSGIQQDPSQQGSMKMMNIIMPLFSVYIGFVMPASLGLYWIVGNILSIVQDYFLTKYYRKKFAEEDAKKAQLEARRKAAEEKLKEENRLRRQAEAEEHRNKNKKYRVAKQPGQKKRLPEKASEEAPSEPPEDRGSVPEVTQ